MAYCSGEWEWGSRCGGGWQDGFLRELLEEEAPFKGALVHEPYRHASTSDAHTAAPLVQQKNRVPKNRAPVGLSRFSTGNFAAPCFLSILARGCGLNIFCFFLHSDGPRDKI